MARNIGLFEPSEKFGAATDSLMIKDGGVPAFVKTISDSRKLVPDDPCDEVSGSSCRINEAGSRFSVGGEGVPSLPLDLRIRPCLLQKSRSRLAPLEV